MPSSIPKNDVTIQRCIGACRDLEKTIAVLASEDECHCGDDSVDYWRYGEAIPGLPILPDTQAVQYNTQQCPGDHGTSPYIQGCGADWQFDVYDTSFGACGGDYTDSSGYIYSPNFPGNYANEQSCTWTITVDHGHIVKLTTLMLRLQDNDMVIVKDGIEDHNSTISTFTGYSLPQPVYSSSNTLRIEMITDDVGNDLGFALQYEALFISERSTGNGDTSKQVTLISKSTESATSPETANGDNATSPLKDM
ncbi:kremen protein 1-like isoform X2 [Ptychodera flava]|uniref:kremen protein 1-like isoform X2 n=1 Tax=Ptychodera flava TaxID=63121 RepID=UPI003969C55A